MIDYIILIKVFFLSWFIVRFEPIQWILDLLPNNILKYILITMTTCLKCSNFWIGLILCQDIFIASGMAFIGMLYEKTIGKFETSIKLN
jgi:hypothetical protein